MRRGRLRSIAPTCECKTWALRLIALPAKEREDQTQHDADNDAGDDWEIKNRVAAFDPDIAWKLAQKSRAHAAPENDSDNGKGDADDDEKLSDLRHDSILVSNSVVSSAGRLYWSGVRFCWAPNQTPCPHGVSS